MELERYGRYEDLYDAIRLMHVRDLLVWDFRPDWKLSTLRSRISELNGETGFVLHMWMHRSKIFVARCE